VRLHLCVPLNRPRAGIPHALLQHRVINWLPCPSSFESALWRRNDLVLLMVAALLGSHNDALINNVGFYYG
jgi:hypothetical protein